MTMLYSRLIAMLVVCAAPALAGVGQWKSFTAKREVRDVTFRDSVIWAATSGGMFSSHLDHSEYREFTTSEGLKTTDLTAITADASGNLWIGAQNGFLHMYNPATNAWQYIADLSIRTEPNKRINALQVAGDTLFILSDIGVSLFSLSKMEFGDTYRLFGVPPNQLSGATTSLAIFQGNLWVGTRNGVASTSVSNPNPTAPESWQVSTTSQGLSSNVVTALSIFDTVLVASTSNGLDTTLGNAWGGVPGTAGLNVIGMTDELTYRANGGGTGSGVYFITQHDMWRYDRGSITKIDSLNAYDLTRISHEGLLGTQKQGALTFYYGAPVSGTSGSYLGGVLGVYVPPGPTSNNFVGVAVDNRGVIWAGTGITNGEGFMRYDGATWKTYTSAEDSRLASNNFYRVNIGRDNAKWVSSWGDGVALLDDAGTVQRVFNTANGLSPSIDPTFVVVGGVATDANGNAWIANRTPRGDTAVVVFAVDSSLGYVRGITTRALPVSVLADVIIDQLGTKWFANFSRYEGVLPTGCWFYNESYPLPNTNGGWGKITSADGLATNKVYCVAVGRDNEVWLGSDAGVSIIYDPSNPFAIAPYHPQQVQDQIVQCMVVDPLNNKWLGTKQGVFVLSSDGTTLLQRYTVQNTDGKLLDDDIASIAIDGQTGVLYFGTEKGLASLRTTAVEPQRSFTDLLFTPNPLLIPSSAGLTIDGLIQNSFIKIISIDGSVVAEFPSPGGRIAFWDGRNNRGEYVGTGIYIVVAYSEDGTKVAKGKVAVVRK